MTELEQRDHLFLELIPLVCACEKPPKPRGFIGKWSPHGKDVLGWQRQPAANHPTSSSRRFARGESRRRKTQSDRPNSPSCENWKGCRWRFVRRISAGNSAASRILNWRTSASTRFLRVSRHQPSHQERLPRGHPRNQARRELLRLSRLCNQYAGYLQTY